MFFSFGEQFALKVFLVRTPALWHRSKPKSSWSKHYLSDLLIPCCHQLISKSGPYCNGRAQTRNITRAVRVEGAHCLRQNAKVLGRTGSQRVGWPATNCSLASQGMVDNRFERPLAIKNENKTIETDWGSQSAVVLRLICGSSKFYQRDCERPAFLAADQRTGAYSTLSTFS